MELSHQPETTSRRITAVIRGAGLAIPLLFALYTLLIQYEIIETGNNLVTMQWALALCALWITLGIFQFLRPASNRMGTLLRFIANHLIASSFLLLVAGFASPLVYTWAIMIVAMYLYFGMSGMFVSISILILVATLDVLVHGGGALMSLNNLIVSGTTALIGGLAAGSMRGISIDQREIDQSREQVLFQHERVMTLVNNLTDPVLSTDAEGRIVVYNAAALNLLDTNVELQGRTLDEVLTLRDSNKKLVKIKRELTRATTTKVRDDLVATISGEPLRLELTLSPIRSNFNQPDSHDGGYIIIMRDITTAKSLEEERDEFISVVSHELRTPITIAEGTISNVQLMLGRKEAISAGKVAEAVDMAHEQVVFLAKMVNDLSTLSRAERGVADSAEYIALEPLVHDIYTEYQPQAAEKNLAFDLHVPTRLGGVMASRLYLKELIQNFVTNAIKYTKEGSLTLEVRTHAKDNTVTLAVRDTGIGISNADQKRIFDKFYRSEDYRTRETGGTGLGLYVAVKLASKLGTKIDMKSRLNHGSTFSFTLPLAEKPHDDA